MKRALGVDYGDVRIGLALSDGLRMLASPLETIDRGRVAEPCQRIAALVEEHEVDTVVVGMPLHLDGGAGKAAGKVGRFIGLLRPVLPAGVLLVEVDERLSTCDATEKLLSGRRRREFNRGQIDQAAAAVILQDYLDQHQQPLLLPTDDEDRDAGGPWNSGAEWDGEEEEGQWDDDDDDDDEDEDEDADQAGDGQDEDEWTEEQPVVDPDADDDEDDEDEDPAPPEGDWDDDKDDLGALVDDDEDEWSEDDEDEDDWDDEDDDDDDDDDDEDEDEDEDEDDWEDDEDDDDGDDEDDWGDDEGEDEDEDEDEREDSRWGRVWDGFSDDD